MLLLMIHNQKNPNNQQIKLSYSTWTRIKQEYNRSTKRTIKCKSTTMSVDDSVLTTFQALLNDIFIKYDDYSMTMNSGQIDYTNKCYQLMY